jgi:regulator of protease activity HflC (stomatin/prohibitin superfamily)
MDSSQTLMFVVYAMVWLFVLGTLLSGFFQVRTAESVIIQRMGKFLCVANAGMNFKLRGWIRLRGELIYACSSSRWTWKPKPKTTCS